MPIGTEDDQTKDGYLLIQKPHQNSTPQKDVNVIKNKFDSSNDIAHQSY